MLALKQHFKNRRCGRAVPCTSWNLKASELETMWKSLSEKGQSFVTPTQEWFIIIQSFSSTALLKYWTHRICALEQTFRMLFTRLRLPEEKQRLAPCSEVSAVVILAAIMSEVTLTIRRRSVTRQKLRERHISRLLNFLKLKGAPHPCISLALDESNALTPSAATTNDDCKGYNAFMHIKSQIHSEHAKVRYIYREI